MRILRDDIADRFLPAVSQPAQYCGLEHNRCCSDVTGAEVTAALAFPDAYTVGISHLGTQILYTRLNSLPGVACDRAYCPLPDAEAVLRREGIPLFGWESRAALADFDVLGFSLSYELVMTNALTMLDLAGVPLHAEDRDGRHPLVVAGGTQADAPEVMADFIDVFLVGDGEEPLPQLVELVRKAKRVGVRREELLAEVARSLPSAYVPALWRPSWARGGALADLAPVQADLPREIRRSCVDLTASPDITHPLVPATSGVFDRISIEIMRGCPHGCRFCHAGAVKKPIRRRSVQAILDTAQAAVDNTGYREVSLLSLSTSDYPELPELITRMNEQFAPQHVSIAVPSLRTNEQLAHLPWQLNQVRKGGMTVAVEAAGGRLREAIGKNITDEDLLAGVSAAYQAGWKSVKVYFMAGFPGETDEDLEAIIALCRRISAARKPIDNHKGAVTASVSWFVPKPHTALQWAPQRDEAYFWHARTLLRDLAKRSPVTVKCHRIERSVLEGVIARGDRRLGAVIETAWRLGARFDGWDEHFRYDLWLEAFKQSGVDPAFFAHRRRPLTERLPWDHVIGHRSQASLAAGWNAYCETMALAPEADLQVVYDTKKGDLS